MKNLNALLASWKEEAKAMIRNGHTPEANLLLERCRGMEKALRDDGLTPKPKWVGYHDPKTLPIKVGDTVQIKKGTQVRSTHPQRGGYEAKRTMRVKVHAVLCGSDAYAGREAQNPRVTWAGSAGYWCEADINDAEKVEE